MLLEVNVKNLNKRSRIPASFADKDSIIGIVKNGFRFQGDEVSDVPNPALGKWYKDRDNYFYWAGGLTIVEQAPPQGQPNDTPVTPTPPVPVTPPPVAVPMTGVTPALKEKIEQIVNAFETGSAEGDYAELDKMRDYRDPETGEKIVQVTYGRSQTTEFSHLKALVQDYVMNNGVFAEQFRPYLNRIGVKPSLATDTSFCNFLINAGKNDPIMRVCQDKLFEKEYYQPAQNWFTKNGFTLPLSMLVIYDSQIHSGGILGFLRNKFETVVPVKGGDEKEWITNYVKARDNWLANSSDQLLRNTVYRTKCFMDQMTNNNWDLSQPVNAHGISIA